MVCLDVKVSASNELGTCSEGERQSGDLGRLEALKALIVAELGRMWQTRLAPR